MTTTMTPGEVRQKAAELIEDRGWTQEEFEGEDGGLCALAAILVAAREVPYSPPWGATATYVVALVENELGVQDLSNWNDEPERTAADVIAALRGRS